MNIECRSFDLQLKHPFTISRGTTQVQSTLIVKVEHDGLTGLGEATTNEYYGISLESMQRALHEVRPQLTDYRLENPAELWRELDPILQDCRFAQCALDCAVWDLFAQMHAQPLWQLWGFHADDVCPPSSFTIGLDQPKVMLEKMGEMPDWPIYKIKLGQSGGPDLVRQLREANTATFRVDANCSWSAQDVPKLSEQLAHLNVEFIEQPLPADEWASMQQLKGQCSLPILADESCLEERDIDRCIDTFDGVNIKLVKCGGLTPARRMITRAKQNGLAVMVGCMTESSIGIAAGVHLLPLLDYADLDGALLLERDIAAGLEWERGYCKLPSTAGIGVKLVDV